MFLILNRLRGTYGWFAAVLGIGLFAAMYLMTKSLTVAALIGVGYWFGEMICGWGNHIGVTTVHRWQKFKTFPEDGDSVGVRWLTSMITHPKLWKLHLKNAKNGIYNIYAKSMNLTVKGWSLARLLKKTVVVRAIEEFDISNALTYARVFLVIRGIYWWTLPMIGVGVLAGWSVAIVSLAVLSLGWPLCAELGYMYSDKIKWHKFGLSYEGGWELQEGFYGLLMDLVVVGIVLTMLFTEAI